MSLIVVKKPLRELKFVIHINFAYKLIMYCIYMVTADTKNKVLR